jgi:hypothetical protein
MARREMLVHSMVSLVVVGAVVAVPQVVARADATGAWATLVANVSTTAEPGYPSGTQHTYDGRSSAVQAYLTATDLFINITASTGPAPDGDLDLDLTAPDGRRLQPGYYPHTNDAGVNPARWAGIFLGIGSEEVSYGDGDVDIRDLASDGLGNLTRLDLLFRSSMMDAAGVTFGEIRIGEADHGGLSLSAQSIVFPQSAVGSVPIRATDVVTNTSMAPQKLGKIALSSGLSSAFRIASDTCSSITLAPDATCSFLAEFAPSHAGPASARVSVPVGSTVTTVSLDGYAPPGVTEQVSSGNDYVDGGKRWDYRSGPYQEGVQLPFPNPDQRLIFSPSRVYDFDPGFEPISVMITAPAGQSVKPGVHATGLATDDRVYNLNVSGDGRGCNDTTGMINVKQLVYGADGYPTHADITFTQRCIEAPTVPMTGELKWRHESDTTGPGAVPKATLSKSGSTRRLGWTNPTAKDFAYTVVRLTIGKLPAATASAGTLLYAGRPAGTITLPSLRAGTTYTITFITVDTSGNTSTARTITFAT